MKRSKKKLRGFRWLELGSAGSSKLSDGVDGFFTQQLFLKKHQCMHGMLF